MPEITGLTLYRPVGLIEAHLILKADGRAFPPRLPHQPIFYPVLNQDYARQIAAEWNTKDETSGFAGFVTCFRLAAQHAQQFPVQTVGATRHQELWVPAEALEEFNRHILGRVEFLDSFYGPNYVGPEATVGNLKGRVAMAQLEQLSAVLAFNGMDFIGDVSANWQVVRLNFAFWRDCSALPEPERTRILSAVRRVWRHDEFPLP